jgi:hypothetical protein
LLEYCKAKANQKIVLVNRKCKGFYIFDFVAVWYNREMNKSKPGLYANINARRKAGTSRPKSKSTISPKVWRLMKAKKGGFEPR